MRAIGSSRLTRLTLLTWSSDHLSTRSIAFALLICPHLMLIAVRHAVPTTRPISRVIAAVASRHATPTAQGCGGRVQTPVSLCQGHIPSCCLRLWLTYDYTRVDIAVALMQLTSGQVSAIVIDPWLVHVLYCHKHFCAFMGASITNQHGFKWYAKLILDIAHGLVAARAGTGLGT
eukprot:6187809-Pleurochrysis_carterae.AAC.1